MTNLTMLLEGLRIDEGRGYGRRRRPSPHAHAAVVSVRKVKAPR